MTQIACRRRLSGHLNIGMVLATLGAWSVMVNDTALAQPEYDTVRLARCVRASLGYDPTSLAALDVPTLAYAAIVQEALEYAQDNDDTLAPLVAELAEGHFALGDPRTADSPEDAIASVTDAYAAVRQSASDLETTLSAMLPVSAAAAHSQAAANAGLDPLLRLLSLSGEQRSAIWSELISRDAVARNPYRWNRWSLVSKARSDFQSQVADTLTSEQLDLIAIYEESLEGNLDEALEIEDTIGSWHGSAAHTWPALAAAGSVLQPAVSIIARWLESIVGYLDSRPLTSLISPRARTSADVPRSALVLANH